MRLALPFLLLSALVAGAAPVTPDQREASVAYVFGLRNPDGGFRAASAAGPSSLGATSSSLRAIKYFGGKPKHADQIHGFVMTCYHPSEGAFSDAPGGTPDVRSTAMGLMSLAELKSPVSEVSGPAIRYFGANAKSLPDIYIAAAALDAAGLKFPDAARWISTYEATRNPDGSFGKTPADTAGAVITILRLGGAAKEAETPRRQIRAAQQTDGGFAGAMGSDLSSCYRAMRALRMLKAKPDLGRLREFIGRCRNADGGYGPAPGQPSAGGPTYFAGIILHWAGELE